MRSVCPPLGLLALFLSACNCSSVGADSDRDASLAHPCSCPDAQTCDPNGSCVPALSEGQLCAEPDGGAVVGACTAGLACGPAGANERCSIDCSPGTGAALCGPGRTCFDRSTATSSASGYCGTAAALGAMCDEAQLTRCVGDLLVCLSPSGQTQGSCYHYCDPSVPDPNPECAGANASCAQLFADQTEGVCVIPAGHYPASCDYAQMSFCARHEVCLRPDDAKTSGYCHLICKTTADCPSGQECTSPSAGLTICAVPVPRCASDPSLAPDAGGCSRCSPDDDQYCGPLDVCVRLADIPVCKQDCTDGSACAQGTCQKLAGSDRSACL